MPLNPKYVLAPSLQMYFVNKDTGLPLDNGYVDFFVDNTSVRKPVFTIVANGSDYQFVQLPNPSFLSAVGTFQNASGVDILPYYYPYDANGNIQLYTIKVYDKNGVLQFSRMGWPNLSASQTLTGDDVTNFVPNGQFLLHNNIPASTANGFIADKVSSNTTILGQGGWSFNRDGTGFTDLITFPRYNSPVTVPTGNPRYAVRINTTVAGTGATRRDLSLKFPDVNTFASTSEQFNLYFEGQSFSGSDIPIGIYVHKYFGSGGSAETFTFISTITLKANQSLMFNTPITFGSNAGMTLGTNDDDYVEIVLRLPLSSTQVAQFTDFALTVGNTALASFPIQTEAQQIGPSTAGWLPEPSPVGQDLYLASILTPSGMTFDHSEIGDIVSAGNLSNFSGSFSTLSNRLLADGSQYRYNDYSSLGIPFSRLGNYYIAGGTGGVPQYGTGNDYATGYIETVTTQNILFTLNKVGLQTAPVDSVSMPSGFTFKLLIDQSSGPIPVTVGFNFVGYTNGSTLVTAIGNVVGAALVAPSAQTSTMTVNSYRNIAGTYQAIQITAVSAAALAVAGLNPAKYFFFSNTTTNYYMWFQTATETDPGPIPLRTGIKVILDPLMSAIDVARVIANAMAGYQEYQITAVAGSAVPAGSYFQFTANNQLYVPWFKVNGIGNDPLVANSISIPVTILSTDTNAQVASKTQVAINQFYFKVPNLQGLFLRGYDPVGEWDIDYLNRFSVGDSLLGGSPGTMELDQIDNHTHTGTTVDIASGPVGGAFTGVTGVANPGGAVYSLVINASGGSESRPVNMSVVWAIKY